MGLFGDKLAPLGFGLMRLPKNGDDIDLEASKQMVDDFLAAGFTYFDTAYGYPGSEVATKAILVDRYPRESFQLATKLPAWEAKTSEAARAMIETSLERTGAGYIDNYLLHNISALRYASFEKHGIWDFVQRLKSEGIVRHVGFSFHDNAPLLERVLTEHPEMEFVQLQINWADWLDPIVDAKRCYEVARAYGKPVIVMEPVKGGSLVTLPDAVAKVFDAADPKANSVEWSMRFAASLPGVQSVLSGASSIEQMRQNIRTMQAASPATDADARVYAAAAKALREVPHVPCTSCQYCVSTCPKRIPIHLVMKAMNRSMMFGDHTPAKFDYLFETKQAAKASECVHCGACTRVCPQEIDIPAMMQKAVEMFE